MAASKVSTSFPKPPLLLLLLLLLAVTCWGKKEEYPEGYYPFHEDALRTPPKVRKPPYTQTEEVCSGMLEDPDTASRSLDNLCGDLNTGQLPRNPLGQNVLGASYPFELIKNQTLELFSKTLPILKEDRTLPKVAKFVTPNVPLRERFRVVRRPTRSLHEEMAEATWTLFKELPHQEEPATTGEARSSTGEARSSRGEARSSTGKARSSRGEEDGEKKASGRTSSRRGRFLGSDDAMWGGLLNGIFNGLSLDQRTAGQIIKNLEFDQKMAAGRGVNNFCQNNWGLFCLLYNTMTGQDHSGPVATERRDTIDPSLNSLEEGAPLTPCPSAVEYVTPVFARNYQGVWRYVVQIPYEGYFTQTVEITQCMQDTCHYLSGSCLASPRWVSLLVAEIFYPDAVFPNKPGRPALTRGSVQPAPHRPDQFQQRQGLRAPAPRYCDGVDQIGCFQVRLYYDWFLVPGSCKCWKRNVFQQSFRHR